MELYNSLSRTIEKFEPQDSKLVTMYSCGPTVYDYAHIGNLRSYVFVDVLKSVLQMHGYKVNHVMNITDVGHLTGDDDDGEDKLEIGATKYGKTPEEVAQFFTDFFFKSTDAINITRATTICKATDNIPEMIALIQKLEEKGHTYVTSQAVYFDISTFPEYGKLSRQKLDEKIQQARDEVVSDPEKKHPADFALWFLRVGKFATHTQHWDSPWGAGFPGWHIECSAMSMKYLGETLDIHTGGIDHIPVHHENEIAQSEAVTGKPFVRYWLHNEFIMINNEKMSKSKNNLYTIGDIVERNFGPLALRYLFLQTHYRQKMNFSWEALDSAQLALTKLYVAVGQLQSQTQRNTLSEDKLAISEQFMTDFTTALSHDLNTAQALATVWSVIKSNVPSEDKLDLLYSMDDVLKLDLRSMGSSRNTQSVQIPKEIQKLVEERDGAKARKDYDKADQIRTAIELKGYTLKDTAGSTEVTPKTPGLRKI